MSAPLTSGDEDGAAARPTPSRSGGGRGEPGRTWRDRFWQQVEVGDPEACWPWLGHVSRWGYGRSSLRGAPGRAHRLAYVLANGDIPDGHVVHHECGRRDCVNPAHLRAMPVAEHNRHHALLLRAATTLVLTDNGERVAVKRRRVPSVEPTDEATA